MKASEHESKTLKYIKVVPDDYDENASYPTIILLHGFGAHMGDLAGLSPAIDANGYVYIFPNAPITLNMGMGTGYAWMPPRNERGSDDTEKANDTLTEFIDEIVDTHSIDPGNVLLGGFSQGAMMTYRHGLTNPDRFRGLIALSGSVQNPEDLKDKLPDSRSQPVFVAHGTHDQVLTIENGHSSKSFLEDNGYAPEYHEYPMQHEITQDVLDNLVVWVHSTLPPFSSK